MEGRHIPQPQEEEHPRQTALIPGEILRGHGRLAQLHEIRHPTHPVIKRGGIQHRGIAVVHIHPDGAAGLLFHRRANVQQRLTHRKEDLILEGPQAPLHMGVVGQGVAHPAAFKFSEVQQSEHGFWEFALHFHGPGIEHHSSG